MIALHKNKMNALHQTDFNFKERSAQNKIYFKIRRCRRFVQSVHENERSAQKKRFKKALEHDASSFVS